MWVPKVGNCNDLRRSASELLKIPSQNIVLAEVVHRSNNIRKLYRGVDKIVFLSSSPLVLYEMPISVYRTTSPPTLQRMSSMESGISLIRVVVMSTTNFTFLIPVVSSKISSPRLYDLVSSKCDGEFSISIVSRNETNETKTILSRTDNVEVCLDSSTHHLEVQISEPPVLLSNITDHASLVEGERKIKARQTTLSECLKLFHAKEIMCGENAVECDTCKKRTKHESSQILKTLPPVLVFHLKRFTQVGYTREKLDTFVKFPLQGLDMAKYVQAPSPVLYDCYAVVHHKGGYGGGHYVAHARDSEKRSWYLFDDARVTISEKPDDEVVQKSAYLLFYERRGNGCGGGEK